MNHRIIQLVLILCIAAAPAMAHTPLLMLEDNEDGTLTVEGGFSTGAGAAGVDFYVKAKVDQRIILQDKFPESSIIELDIPKEPYYLVFDGGPGHKVVKDGVPPPEGFTVNQEAASLKPEKSDSSGIPLPLPVLLILVAVAALLVFVLPKISGKKKKET